MKRLNLPLVIAVLLIAIAGFGFYSAYKKEQNQITIMVAAHALPPYIAVATSDLKPTPVSQSSYIKGQDLSESDYQKTYNCAAVGCKPMIPTVPILGNQRIDVDSLAIQPQQSFSIVLPDERVVAASSSISGAALGVVQPGNIVDVQTAGSGSQPFVSTYAKVLCISADATGCKGVLGTGQSPSIGKVASSNLGSSSGGAVQILLAVSQGDADQIAGQQVSLSLNTYCQVDQLGFFVSVQKQLRCNPPSDRMASDQQLRSQREAALNKAISQGSQGASTTTTGTTTTGQTGTSTSSTTTGSQNAPATTTAPSK